jgi:uncharacterized protein YbaP (TraB family)
LQLFLAFAVAHLGLAQEKKAAATAARHSLWKVQGKNCSLYLLGSVHALKPEQYPLPAVIESAFNDSQIVAFETDIAAMEDPAMAMKLMSKAKLPEGQTLQTQLSPEIYQQLTNHLKGSMVPMFMMEQFTPGFAAMMLVVSEIQKMGLDPNYGLDKHFFPLAQKAQKKIVPLETVEFQMDLLTTFTKAEGESLIKSTLKDIDTMEKEFGDLIKAWETGDDKGLEKILNKGMEEEPVIYKRLLTDRNKNWIPKLEEMLQGDKNAIVIVGAGHLVGKEGVVELLKKKGNKVVQL